MGLGTNVHFLPTHDCVHTILTSQLGHNKRVLAQTCLGANVYGHKCVVTNVLGHKRMWA